MDIARTGIILNTQNYTKCVSFYRETFDLNVVYEKHEANSKLTCLDFGGAYLMIETGGIAYPQGKSMEHGSLKLRINVTDLDLALKTIRKVCPHAEIIEFSWGSTINIVDPDGNRVGVRDEATFTKQLDDFT